jgi:hypothetical protein
MSKLALSARVAARFLEKKAQNPLLEEHLAEYVDAEMEADEEASISRPTPMAGEMDQVAVAPPGWENTVKKMKKHDEIDNPWALAWSMKNKGDTPGGKKEGMDNIIPTDTPMPAEENGKPMSSHFAKTYRR